MPKRIVYVLQYRLDYADYAFRWYMGEELYTEPLQDESDKVFLGECDEDDWIESDEED